MNPNWQTSAEAPIIRVLKNVKIHKNGCWEWQGCKNKAGYGLISIKNKTILTHRISYLTFIGELDNDKEFVCHKCDNPSCINPFHLFKGTGLDNYNDALFKGRVRSLTHGRSGYRKGCRCDECRKIKSGDNKKYKSKI